MTALKERSAAFAQRTVMQKILRFLDGYYYPPVYAVLALISSLTGLEIAFFYLTAAVIVFACLFAEDTRSILVPLVLVMFGMSWRHTPQPPYNSEYLNSMPVLIALSVLGVIGVSAFVYRMIVWRGGNNFFRGKSAYKWSIAALTAAFLLNGAFFSGYTAADLFLGVLFALSFFAMYIFFFNTLKRREGQGKYMAYLLVLASAVICLQLFKILLFDGVIEDGSINKDLLIAGWGMSNNIGGYLAAFLPAPFYLSYKCRHGWAFYILGFFLYGCVLLTLSRSAALVGAVALVAVAVYLSVKRSPVRTFARLFNCACVLIAAAVAAVFWEKLRDLFAVFFERGFSDSGRFFIWENGIRNFLRAPIFGVGFYEPIAPDWSYEVANWVFPDLYHNIFIQLIASCGIVGFAALVFHFVQVALAACRRGFTFDRLFYISVLCLILGLALLDNHMFHVFHALVYSVFLLFTEREQSSVQSRGTERGEAEQGEEEQSTPSPQEKENGDQT